MPEGRTPDTLQPNHLNPGKKFEKPREDELHNPMPLGQKTQITAQQRWEMCFRDVGKGNAAFGVYEMNRKILPLFFGNREELKLVVKDLGVRESERGRRPCSVLVSVLVPGKRGFLVWDPTRYFLHAPWLGTSNQRFLALNGSPGSQVDVLCVVFFWSQKSSIPFQLVLQPLGEELSHLD